MKKIAIILGIMLLVSNGWWAYHTLDQGITQTYKEQEFYELKETHNQLAKMMPAISQQLSKDEVIKIASQFSDTDKFYKDGCTWVGWVGLKFNQKGKLESVSPTWFSGGQDPCFPVDKK